MQISQVAQRTGLTPKTIRYYESIGLVAPKRESNGYRNYEHDQIKQLEFVQRARGLGFSIAECRDMLVGGTTGAAINEQTKEILRQRLTDIEVKLTELTALRETLSIIAESYSSDSRMSTGSNKPADGWQAVFGEAATGVEA
jgi:DNA-binding transcriptional MerR regulator